MDNWTSEQTAIPPDRATILDLLRLCKTYRVECLAWQAALMQMSFEHPQFVDQLRAAQKSALSDAEFQVLGQFRRTESALIEGLDYLIPLRQMLQRHAAP